MTICFADDVKIALAQHSAHDNALRFCFCKHPLAIYNDYDTSDNGHIATIDDGLTLFKLICQSVDHDNDNATDLGNFDDDDNRADNAAADDTATMMALTATTMDTMTMSATMAATPLCVRMMRAMSMIAMVLIITLIAPTMILLMML